MSDKSSGTEFENDKYIVETIRDNFNTNIDHKLKSIDIISLYNDLLMSNEYSKELEIRLTDFVYIYVIKCRQKEQYHHFDYIMRSLMTLRKLYNKYFAIDLLSYCLDIDLDKLKKKGSIPDMYI